MVLGGSYDPGHWRLEGIPSKRGMCWTRFCAIDKVFGKSLLAVLALELLGAVGVGDVVVALEVLGEIGPGWGCSSGWTRRC